MHLQYTDVSNKCLIRIDDNTVLRI